MAPETCSNRTFHISGKFFDDSSLEMCISIWAHTHVRGVERGRS